jgi:ParB-like chromosome segregation protein Spo0J
MPGLKPPLSLRKWTLERRRLNELKDYPKNARILSKIQYEHLKNSITRFGIVEKFIVNTDNTLIGGHQRFRILQELAVFEVECWVPQDKLTEDEVDELNIRLNRNVGEWDWDRLANEWDVPQLLGWGFSEGEFFEKPPKAEIS